MLIFNIMLNIFFNQVNPSSCHYLVDLDNGRSSEFEPNYSQQKQHWKVIVSEKFIDASRLEER